MLDKCLEIILSNKSFNLIIELNAVLDIVAMILMIPIVLSITRTRRSSHRWGPFKIVLPLNFHKNLGLES